MPTPITAKSLIAAGLSRSAAHHVMAGSRQLGLPLALWLLDECGLIAPALEGKTARELALLRQMYPPAAPQSVLDRRAANGNAAAGAKAA